MENIRPLPLTALRAFEAAARLGSFTGAAQELAMTQAAVSYQVKRLETSLDAVLFQRQGRYVQLTPAGRRLSASVSEGFSMLRRACAEATNETAARLRITALPTVASNWLVPRLGDFQARHPQYAVQLDCSVDAVDLRASDFDVAIRTGDGQWPGCEALRLFPNAYAAVGASDLAERVAREGVCCLLTTPLFGRLAWWRNWLKAEGLAESELVDLFATDLGVQPSEVTAAVLQGGAAIVTPAFFADELKSGRLALLAPRTFPHSSYWLAYRKGAAQLPNVRDFRRWLLSQVASEG